MGTNAVPQDTSLYGDCSGSGADAHARVGCVAARCSDPTVYPLTAIGVRAAAVPNAAVNGADEIVRGARRPKP